MPEPFRIRHLCKALEEYLEPEQVSDVYRAYLFSAEAHEGQRRLSGEPYITHPIAVARILAELHMDHQSLMAAILHDVIEDTETVKDQIKTRFSEEVAELVDGVSKLTHIHFESRAEAQAENFRKMMLAMVRDIRVILIKLADRLHNMRTLGVMRPDKRRRIARETLEIYGPIANRLGMNYVRLELEDLGFKAMYPVRSRILEERLKKARGNRKEIVSKIEDTINTRLAQEGPAGRVQGREKHLYSIYLKMKQKHLPFSEIMDVYAFRIIVDSVDDCYRMLGVMHSLYTPMPGRFKDYIAIPKTNGYQSLHTVLFSPYGVAIEVQIRTEEMDKVAEAGIAAHWRYKTSESVSNNAQIRARQWLHDLLEIQQNAGNSEEFLENVKIDLFPHEVYVFTPKGEIMELAQGATAVDFAYAVHSDVGNQCVAVKIDRRLMPLRTELSSGQTVEIITSKGAQPNPAWLDFVHTAKARSNIRHFLKNLRRNESITLGIRLLNKSLAAHNSGLDQLADEQIQRVLDEYGFDSMEAMYSTIGLGSHMPMVIARALLHADHASGGDASAQNKPRPLAIKGTEGAVVTFAKCCRPIPGDPILGFVTSGRGIVIHTEDCKNVAEYRGRPEKWIDVEWEKETAGEFPIDIQTLVENHRGVLAKVAANLAEMDANIENVNIEERDGMHSILSFTVAVQNRKHLARIMRRIRSLEYVMRIYRVKR